MTTSSRVITVVVLASTLAAILSAQQDGRPASGARVDPLTASIRGRVTAFLSGAPVGGAEVRVTSAGSYNRLAAADADGYFELSNLPAGEYMLTASRAGFTSMRFGQRRAFDAPRSIELSEGETFTANVLLIQGGAIYGRIYDEFGDPVTGIRVQALRARTVQGQRRLQSVGRGDQTDDTGAFRLFGLAPGDYFVSASVVPADSVGREPPIYYPGTPSFADAQPITLGGASEVPADFQLVPVRNATVSGLVLDSSGAPAEAMVSLTSEAISIGPTIDASVPALSLIGDSRADGRFRIENVPPGPYVLRASLAFTPGGPGSPVFGGQSARGASAGVRSVDDVLRLIPETAALPLVVGGSDLSDITLVMRPGAVLTGTIVADAGVARPLPAGLRVTARGVPAGGMMLSGGRGSGFRLGGLSGPFYLDIQGVPDGWAVSSVQVGGAEVTDQAIDLQGRDATARVVLTDRVTTVMGTIRSRDGQTDYDVVVFADDPTKRAYPSRHVRTARTDDQGRFLIRGLPPNERYLAVAIGYLEDGDATDPQLLESLESGAESFTLREGEQRSMFLDPRSR